jgi:UDP-N-acetylmuramoylalanine--D-glutamate ligase
VKRAAASAESGDVVLLAPACASFDQFDNYEHRGRVFKQTVQALAEQG